MHVASNLPYELCVQESLITSQLCYGQGVGLFIMEALCWSSLVRSHDMQVVRLWYRGKEGVQSSPRKSISMGQQVRTSSLFDEAVESND